MPFIIDEKKMVNDNTFLYEERVKAPTARFLDVTQTYTTYYHIDVDQTTTDTGFADVASIIGFRSPIRFQKIEDFPIYGLEQIVLQLQDTDQGIDTNYEGEAIILNNAKLKPLPNDFFTIPVLKQYYLFRVTDIQFDNIMSDNFYRISFKIECNDSVEMQKLEKQVIDENIFDLSNVGTEKNCIIKKSVYKDIEKIEEMKNRIIDFYMSMYYSERYNVFLCPLDSGDFFYDPLQTDFINMHQIMNKKNDLVGITLTDQYPDVKRQYKYNKSIYRFVETKKMELLSRFPYTYIPGRGITGSSFELYHDNTIKVFDYFTAITKHTYYLFSEEMVNFIKLNLPVEGDYASLLQRYVRSEIIQIKEIPLTLDEELLYLNDSLEVYIYTPIILYIIQNVITENLKEVQKKEQEG